MGKAKKTTAASAVKAARTMQDYAILSKGDKVVGKTRQYSRAEAAEWAVVTGIKAFRVKRLTPMPPKPPKFVKVKKTKAPKQKKQKKKPVEE